MRVNDRVGREKIALCGALLAVDTEEDDAGIPTPRKAKRPCRDVWRAQIKNSSSVVPSRSSVYSSFVICSLNLTASTLSVWEELLYAWTQIGLQHLVLWLHGYNNLKKTLIRIKMLHVDTSVRRFWFDTLRRLLIPNKTDGLAPSDHVFTVFVANTGRSPASPFSSSSLCIFSIMDATRRITAPCRSKVQLT